MLLVLAWCTAATAATAFSEWVQWSTQSCNWPIGQASWRNPWPHSTCGSSKNAVQRNFKASANLPPDPGLHNAPLATSPVAEAGRAPSHSAARRLVARTSRPRVTQVGVMCMTGTNFFRPNPGEQLFRRTWHHWGPNNMVCRQGMGTRTASRTYLWAQA